MMCFISATKMPAILYIYISSFFYTPPHRYMTSCDFRLKSPHFCLIEIILFFLASLRPHVLSVRIDTMHVLNASLALCLCWCYFMIQTGHLPTEASVHAIYWVKKKSINLKGIGHVALVCVCACVCNNNNGYWL